MKQKEKSPLYKAHDIRRIFGVTDMTIHRWIKDGKLPKPIKMGRIRYWKKEDVDSIVNSEPGTSFGGE